ncbi:antibiotic biosynthesis monooxygenase [Erythrobacter sp. Dej080120_24]|jgi:quinol monooxygenase YgiN|uniref:putative quinol monooxygenase n=1 Tax=Erythrobacter sp. Dej080120_24 TaxID=3024837 RepID=UPI0029216515|nr:antibiotic biosynthesis monooxygenase [Erythrobacter sp. Dej080120_24]
MIIVVGSFRIPPSMIEVVIPVMEHMIKASRAEEGCIEYAYALDVLDKGLVRVSEKWRDRAALEAHFRTAHIAEWRAQVSSLAMSERELTAHETDDGFYI